jgi:hypothetical protein
MDDEGRWGRPRARSAGCRNQRQAAGGEQAGGQIGQRSHARLGEADDAERGAKFLLGESLVVQGDGQRRARDRGHRVQDAQTATEQQPDGFLGSDWHRGNAQHRCITSGSRMT